MLKSSSPTPEFVPNMPPFAHQQEVLDLSCKEEYFGFFMDMGTGKSKVIIDTIVKLYLAREIDGVLIIAPKGGYLNWIDDEIPIHMPEYITKRVAHFDVDYSKLQFRIAHSLLAAKDDILDIMVINIEALNTDRGFEFAETFCRSHYTMTVIDESTCIKNHKAKRTKAAYKLGKLSNYRRILTGTPITDSPLDLYGQCEFLKPGLLGFDNWVSFQTYFAIVRLMTQGSRRYEMISGYRNLEELSEKIKKFSYRKKKEDCLDLPEKIFVNKYIEWTPEQERIYFEVKEEAISRFSEEAFVSSTSVITTMIKLHQINCGHVKDDFGNVHDIENNRIQALIQTLKDNPHHKTIIWCNFVRDVELINQAIRTELKRAPVLYYGDTSNDDRRDAIEQFRKGEAMEFVATLSTAAKALTLVESDFAIYYSYDYNLEKWLQSQDRNHRPGQKKNVTYVVFQIPQSVDSRIIKALKAKEDLAHQVLDRDTAIALLG